VIFKKIIDVLVFRECYQCGQCGGETLGPVVKHSVRDSRLAIGSFQAAVLLPVTFWSSRLATARDRFSFELR
jgi:hypothetical protein